MFQNLIRNIFDRTLLFSLPNFLFFTENSPTESALLGCYSIFHGNIDVKKIQSNFNGLNPFGTIKFVRDSGSSNLGRLLVISATPGGTMKIIVGYLFGVLYFICMLCVLMRQF